MTPKTLAGNDEFVLPDVFQTFSIFEYPFALFPSLAITVLFSTIEILFEWSHGSRVNGTLPWPYLDV